MNANIGIFEANYYLPATKKALSQVFEDEEKPTEAFAANVDFEKDIGIEALHVAKNETAADLCINAAKLTMAKSGIDPKEIEIVRRVLGRVRENVCAAPMNRASNQ